VVGNEVAMVSDNVALATRALSSFLSCTHAGCSALTKRLMVPAEVSAAGVAAGRESLLFERRLWEQEAACNSVCWRRK
jgi:hypothetical protein